MTSLTRRDFVRLATGSAISLPALLAACGGAAPASAPPASGAPTGSPPAVSSAAASAKPLASVSALSSPSAAAAGAAKPSGTADAGYPTYIPLANKPKPDLPSKGGLYEDGYLKYPANPYKSVTQTPGLGSTVAVLDDGLYPLSTPVDQNVAWQEVNKQLNAKITFNKVPPADYPAKLGALMAGGDLPDLINLLGSPPPVPNLPAFLAQAAADLTPFLGGDAARDYPNLAAIPTIAWRNSGSVINGKLYMVPLGRSIVGSLLIKDNSVWDAELGKDYVPKDAADFKRVLQALNKPSDGRWALGSFSTQFYMAEMFASMFGAPNVWKLDASGKLIRSWETPEYKAAMAYLRDIVAGGLFFPDSMTVTSPVAGMSNFINGKGVIAMRSFGFDYTDGYHQAQNKKPPFVPGYLPPFAANAGDKPTIFLSPGYGAGTVLKNASAARIKELLGILNFAAAPFGSQEDLLLNYGIEGVHYKFDANGNPTTNDKWMQDVYNVDWRYVASRAPVLYDANYPDSVKLMSDTETILGQYGIFDATLGYYSATSSSKRVPLEKNFTDGLIDILSGRRPMTDYDQLVKDWQTGGGEQMRKEFMDSIAAAK